MSETIRYDADTDTMLVIVRQVPLDGGEDAGADLVVHYGVDGVPAAYEIDHASEHPEHLAFVLAQLRNDRREAA